MTQKNGKDTKEDFDDFDDEDLDGADDAPETWDQNAPVENHDGEKQFYNSAAGKIEVKCSNCALWNVDLACIGGKKLCYPGKIVKIKIGDETIQRRMSEDQFSCASYFIPRDQTALLQMLPTDHTTATMIKMAGVLVNKVVDLKQRVTERYLKHSGTPQDADNAMSSILKIAAQYNTKEQVDYSFPFFGFLAEILKPKRVRAVREQKPKEPKFAAGDNVRWTDKMGNVLEGWIQKISNKTKEITLIIPKEYAKLIKSDCAGATNMTYPWPVWKQEYKAEIVSKAVHHKAEEE